ncbi:GGDEF domain-containing protein, partial [Paracraurococcus ruber]
MPTEAECGDQRDPLTGTATPQAMRRFIEAALDLSDSGGPGVVVFAIGLDGLDRLAATGSQGQADAVLLGVGDRLRTGLRTHDLVGRLPQGFVICLAEAFSGEARRAAQRLQRVVDSAPVPTGAGPVAIGCSVGLAFGRGPGSSAADLLDRACAALALAQARSS